MSPENEQFFFDEEEEMELNEKRGKGFLKMNVYFN